MPLLLLPTPCLEHVVRYGTTCQTGWDNVSDGVLLPVSRPSSVMPCRTRGARTAEALRRRVASAASGLAWPLLLPYVRPDGRAPVTPRDISAGGQSAPATAVVHRSHGVVLEGHDVVGHIPGGAAMSPCGV